MIRFLLIALLALTPAYAKDKSKSPAARVDSAFGAMTDLLAQKTLRLPPSSNTYQFHHDIFHFSGKTIIHKECPYDAKNDPGEASCIMVWAAI